MKIKKLQDTKEIIWNQIVKIYEAAFPEWEREPLYQIEKRVLEQRYVVYIGLFQEQTVGFYILDQALGRDFVVFTFLAVTEQSRGQGIGSLLCQHAIKTFYHLHKTWLIIEAEDKPALFYQKLGFKKIAIDYVIPKYDDANEGIAMHLMAISEQKTIDNTMLSNIIINMFTEGYLLERNDPRLIQQLAKLPQSALLTDLNL